MLRYFPISTTSGNGTSEWLARKFFDEEMSDIFNTTLRSLAKDRKLTTNTYTETTEDGVTVYVDLPGFDEKDINVTMDKDVLVVDAKRDKPTKMEVHNKQILIDVDVDRARGEYKNGLLTIFFPFREETKPRKILLK